jgi:hypothetical protein
MLDPGVFRPPPLLLLLYPLPRALFDDGGCKLEKGNANASHQTKRLPTTIQQRIERVVIISTKHPPHPKAQRGSAKFLSGKVVKTVNETTNSIYYII